jgi:hypothetical protein
MTDYAELCRKADQLTESPIPTPLVAPSRRAAAAYGATWTAKQLGARHTPDVVFCRPRPSTDPVNGAARVGQAKEIFVADGLSLHNCVAIAAEETHHALTADGDEDAAKAFGQAAARAWTAQRSEQREQLALALRSVLLRVNGGALDAWQGLASCKRLGAWYGGAAFVRAGLADLGVRLEELESLPPATRHPLALPERKPHPASYSWRTS